MNKQSKEFNITTAVRLEFEKNKNTENLKHILSNLDYSEVSKKQYIIYVQEPGEQYTKQQYINEEETLAQNFMDCLPFEAYKTYVDKKWLNIQFRDYYPLVKSCIYSGNFKMLSMLGDLGFESCLSNEKDHDFYRYKKTYLDKVLNISDVLVNGRYKNKDFYDVYYDIFKKGLVQYKATMEDAHEKMNYHQEIVIDSWLFSMSDYTDQSFRNNNVEKIKDFLSSLASAPQTEKITDDVMGQIKKAQEGKIALIVNGKKRKQKIDILNMIKDSEIIESAIWFNNQNFIDKLQKSLNIPNLLIADKIVSCFEKAVNESFKEVYFNEKYINLLKKNNIGKFVLSQVKHDNEIKEIHHLGLLALSENKETLDYLKNNIKLDNSFFKIKNTTITYKDSITISYIIESYMGPKLFNKNKPLFLEVGNKLIQLGYKPQIENWNDLSKNIKENILPFLQGFYYKDRNQRLELPEGINEWLNQFYLNETLKENPSRNSPKVKI